MLLTLGDEDARNRYLERWSSATANLQRAIEGFRTAAVTAADRTQAELWRVESDEYRATVLQTLEAVESGAITRPTEANDALSPAKGSIRTVTNTAMTVAHAKELAVQSGSDAMRNSFSWSTRIITLIVLVVCVIFTVITRR